MAQSICKNAAHVFALETASKSNLRAEFFVSLDCDNLVTAAYMIEIYTWMENVSANGEVDGAMLTAGETLDCGTCGRIACQVSTWTTLNGYDQELLPVGYQDVDIRQRLQRMTTLPKANWWIKIYDVEKFGGAVPNDPTSRKADRDTAKIANVDPTLLRQPGCQHWGPINGQNVLMSREKMKNGMIIRNRGLNYNSQAKPRLGCWYYEVPMSVLRVMSTLPLDSATVCQAALGASAGGVALPPPAGVASSSATASGGAQRSASYLQRRWTVPVPVEPRRVAVAPPRFDGNPLSLRVRIGTAGLARPPATAPPLARTGHACAA